MCSCVYQPVCLCISLSVVSSNQFVFTTQQSLVSSLYEDQLVVVCQQSVVVSQQLLVSSHQLVVNSHQSVVNTQQSILSMSILTYVQSVISYSSHYAVVSSQVSIVRVVSSYQSVQQSLVSSHYSVVTSFQSVVSGCKLVVTSRSQSLVSSQYSHEIQQFLVTSHQSVITSQQLQSIVTVRKSPQGLDLFEQSLPSSHNSVVTYKQSVLEVTNYYNQPLLSSNESVVTYITIYYSLVTTQMQSSKKEIKQGLTTLNIGSCYLNVVISIINALDVRAFLHEYSLSINMADTYIFNQKQRSEYFDVALLASSYLASSYYFRYNIGFPEICNDSLYIALL